MGTATHLRPSLHHSWGETFHTPYGDSNGSELSLRTTVALETFHTPMGTATNSSAALANTFLETFLTPMGTATHFCNIFKHFMQRNISYPYGDSNIFSAISLHVRPLKYFIPLWGQKENRYVQFDISVFTLFAIIIHILRRPYRAPF